MLYDDAQKLRGILEQERKQAASLGDIVAVIAIGILIAALIALLAGLAKR